MTSLTPPPPRRAISRESRPAASAPIIGSASRHHQSAAVIASTTFATPAPASSTPASSARNTIANPAAAIAVSDEREHEPGLPGAASIREIAIHRCSIQDHDRGERPPVARSSSAAPAIVPASPVELALVEPALAGAPVQDLQLRRLARDRADGGTADAPWPPWRYAMPVTTEDSNATSSPRPETIYSGVERRRVPDGRAAVHEEKVTTATLTGGSTLELLGGAAAVILAIIGLSGYLPLYMTAIATIAIGGALLAHGASVTARWTDTMRQAAADGVERVELAGGIGSELFGGACGIALGILALANVMPLVLPAVAAIVFGGAILLGAPAQPELARVASDRDRKIGRITYQAVEASTGTMVLVGVAAIVLGILALVSGGPALTLVMVAMLGVGGALLLTGGALTARFARHLHQTV